MKAVILIVKYAFLLTGLINTLPVYNQTHSSIEMKTVGIRIIEIGWSGKTWDKINADTSVIFVKEGSEFGGKDSPYYFRLLEITDSNSIKVSFTDDLVIAGEPVNYPSTQNPVTISGEKKCFRMRLFDAGSDFCIEIIKTNNSVD
jgi:hypothetical protein